MAKNITKQFAELLGVELEEEFELTRVSDGEPLNKRYKITENTGLMIYSEGIKNWIPCDGERALLLGYYEIIKQPYQPKKGEEYWTYVDYWQIICGKWGDDYLDYLQKTAGAVFRTREEAIEARPRIYREMTGAEWTEDVLKK